MSGIDKLKKIGVQKIHENTHISRAHIEAIFQENFEDMNNKVQLNGFLSILEREYNVDLSDLKSKVKNHFDDIAKYTELQAPKANLFLVDNKKSKVTFFYIVLGLTIFILFAYLNTNITEENSTQKDENSKVEAVTQNNALPTLAEENIATADENSTALDENSTEIEEIEEVLEVKAQEKPQEEIKEEVKKETIKEKVQEVVKEIPKEEIKEVVQEKSPLKSNVKEVKEGSLKIAPKSKVWIGYIDLSSGKKYQTVSSNELVLDSTKDWLLTFGHGHLNIEANGKLQKYETVKNLRFIYKNGEIKELNLEEFKELNSGKIW